MLLSAVKQMWLSLQLLRYTNYATYIFQVQLIPMNHKVRSNATSVVYCDRYISQWKLPFYSEQVRLIQSKLDLTSLIKMSFGFPVLSLILFLVNCGDTYYESIVFILLY